MNHMKPYYQKDFERAMERKWTLEKQGMELLDQIAAEFSSDPMSRQCFDKRVVDAAMLVSAEYATVRKAGTLF